MDWQTVGERLSGCYQPIIDLVTESYPGIHAGNGWTAHRGVVKFQASANFCYDPVHAESEDLLIMYTCVPVDRASFRTPDGAPVFAGVQGYDGVQFEIERGTGHLLAALDPVLLPNDEESPAYEAAALEFADHACAFVTANTHLILDALRAPYQR